MSATSAYELGLWGEAQVASYLQERGHRILERRWRCRFGELDLVTEDGNFLCFVEVKLRKDDGLMPARVFVTEEKRKKLRLTAELYLSRYPTLLQPRLDVVEVYAKEGRKTKHPTIIYWENAF